MLRFEDYETEQYYYKRMQELRIRHINWGHGDICLTIEEIDANFAAMEDALEKSKSKTLKPSIIGKIGR